MTIVARITCMHNCYTVIRPSDVPHEESDSFRKTFCVCTACTLSGCIYYMRFRHIVHCQIAIANPGHGNYRKTLLLSLFLFFFYSFHCVIVEFFSSSRHRSHLRSIHILQITGIEVVDIEKYYGCSLSKTLGDKTDSYDSKSQ